MLHYLPTIYSLSDANPLATCSGRNHPDGAPVSPSERTYSNSCTTKHGSFGGAGLDTDDYYSAGSDDFRGYVWKIPSTAELTDRRRVISSQEWVTQEHPHVIAFADGMWQPRYVPMELSTPFFRLNGHKSIVNTTLIHPSFPYIMTSGIERHILLHSPKSFSPFSQGLSLTSTDVRPLPQRSSEDRRRFIRALTRPHATLSEEPEESEDELQTIALFDQILRQEGGGDPFYMRRLADSDDDDENNEGTDCDSPLARPPELIED